MMISISLKQKSLANFPFGSNKMNFVFIKEPVGYIIFMNLEIKL